MKRPQPQNSTSFTWLPICHQAVLDAFDLLADASADPDVLADGLSILLAKTVKGVQRQFRNKTTAVLKPLFKAGVGSLLDPTHRFFISAKKWNRNKHSLQQQQKHWVFREFHGFLAFSPIFFTVQWIFLSQKQTNLWKKAKLLLPWWEEWWREPLWWGVKTSRSRLQTNAKSTCSWCVKEKSPSSRPKKNPPPVFCWLSFFFLLNFLLLLIGHPWCQDSVPTTSGAHGHFAHAESCRDLGCGRRFGRADGGELPCCLCTICGCR